jgi:hypothetical protein
MSHGEGGHKSAKKCLYYLNGPFKESQYSYSVIFTILAPENILQMWRITKLNCSFFYFFRIIFVEVNVGTNCRYLFSLKTKFSSYSSCTLFGKDDPEIIFNNLSCKCYFFLKVAFFKDPLFERFSIALLTLPATKISQIWSLTMKLRAHKWK